MTLLSIIQGAAVKCGIPSPSIVVASTDQNVQQLLEIANEVCTDISRMRPPWQALAKLTEWTCVGTEDQGTIATVIGADFDRFVPGTIWDRSLIRPLPGPRSPQGWAQDHAFVAAGPFYSFRIYDGHVWIFPNTGITGNLISWEYVSKYWCESSGGTGQSQWLADDDVSRLDELMIKYAIIVQYKMAKGLPCSIDLVNYQDCLEERRGTDGGNPRTLNLNGFASRYPQWPTLPDGNWPTS